MTPPAPFRLRLAVGIGLVLPRFRNLLTSRQHHQRKVAQGILRCTYRAGFAATVTFSS